MILNGHKLQNIIQMSRGLFSALSTVTIVAGSALYYFWKKNTQEQASIADRLVIKKTLITLRKRFYSTLREIAFIVNYIRTLQGDMEVKKISQIFMRDGGSGQKKLQAIEALVLKQSKITQNQFETSCNYYCQTDIEIKLLLQHFRKDLNMALEGVIESYHGPLPDFTSQKVLRIQEQVVKRRMSIICKKYIEKASNEECLSLEGQIQQYLLEEGIEHQKEPHEKIFMSMLEHYYRHDHEFKQKFQRLQMDLQMFMIDIDNKYAPKESKQSKQEFVPEPRENQLKNQKDRHFFRRKERENENEDQSQGMREGQRNQQTC